MKQLCALGLAAAAAMAMMVTPAAAQTKMKVADSFPVGHYLPKYLTTPMMDRLKADPAHKDVEWEYYPAQQMGKAKDYLQLVQSGVIDIAYVAPSFVSDKLPLSVVAELPLPFKGSCQASKAFWKMARPGGVLDKAEYAPLGVRVLFSVVLPPYQIVTRKSFTKLSELEGQKLRTSGSAKELLIKKLKAVPVLIPTPEVYEAMSRGTIDGALFPLNSIPPYDLHKLSKDGTIGENFGSFVGTWVISEKRFKSLSPKLQADLSAMGDELVAKACAQIEQDEAGDAEKIKAAGVTLAPLPAEDHATMAKVSDEVSVEWAQSMDKRGKAGTEMLSTFKAGLK